MVGSSRSGLRPSSDRGFRKAEFALCAFVLLSLAGAAAAQGEGGDLFSSADEAARQSSNPLGGDFLIMLNQFDNYFLQGDATGRSRSVNSWAFQPVIPLPMDEVIGENWIMVNRPTFPIILGAEVPNFAGLSGAGPPSIPPSGPPTNVPGGRFEKKEGFGDIVMFNLLGQSIPTESAGGGDIVWGVGPTWTFPSASKDELGGGKYSVGPSAVGAFIGKDFILGGLFQHWVDFASGGKGADRSVSFSWLNLFYFYNLPGGWQFGGTPVITSDWEADSDDRWTVPIGLGVYKTQIFGKMPIKMGMEMQYMPIRPDFYGQEFNIRFVIAPVLPSPFGSFVPPGD